MNRVLGDYFETLLYKIFVSIDENTTVAEVSRLWLELFRKNAISLILAWFHTFFIALIGFYFSPSYISLSYFQLAKILEVDIKLVKNCFSILCRLGFAKKKNNEMDSKWVEKLFETNLELRKYIGQQLYQNMVVQLQLC